MNKSDLIAALSLKESLNEKNATDIIISSLMVSSIHSRRAEELKFGDLEPSLSGIMKVIQAEILKTG
jgi:hypothetical protein